MTTLSAIAAMARNRVVGKDNQLCWNIPADLKRFKAITTGHAVVMGRKTYESIGRPLPNRENIVLTRSRDFRPDGVVVVHSLEEALSRCQGRDQAFVIGGGEIWTQAMPRIQRVYLTWVHQDFEGDAYFPELPEDFVEVEREDHLQEPLPYSYVLMQRK